jgi:glycerol dehydrogenase
VLLQAAHELDLPVVIVPSLASTDAPCTALSVVYSDGGAVAEVVYFPRSPAMVVVDTQVVAEAPPAYLIAGMGDAMATWYEARAVARNPAATTKIAPLSYRPPRIAAAIARCCAETLYEHGVQAVADCAEGKVSDALEAVVEANILHSGLGVECGGLAVAHGLHNALTRLPATHSLMHGQKVRGRGSAIVSCCSCRARADFCSSSRCFGVTAGSWCVVC